MDLMLFGQERIDIKYWEAGDLKSAHGLQPRLIVLKSHREMRRYNGEADLFYIWKFQLMDGSESVIRAVN